MRIKLNDFILPLIKRIFKKISFINLVDIQRMSDTSDKIILAQFDCIFMNNNL